MNGDLSVRHEFVESFPAVLEERVVYVSIPFDMAVHLCCCGCGNKVFTPFASRRWKLIYDGETISLRESIGNGSFPCKSHYWITKNTIEWERQLTEKERDASRAREDCADKAYFESVQAQIAESIEQTSNVIEEPTLREAAEVDNEPSPGIWRNIVNWVGSLFHR